MYTCLSVSLGHFQGIPNRRSHTSIDTRFTNSGLSHLFLVLGPGPMDWEKCNVLIEIGNFFPCLMYSPLNKNQGILIGFFKSYFFFKLFLKLGTCVYNKEKEKSVFTVCDTSLLLTEDVKFPKRFFVFSSLLYVKWHRK